MYASTIASVIVEPIAGSTGVLPPPKNYLKRLREICDKHDILLIFDEVMTGFRVGLECAQGIYNITPDITTLGKVIGGGMPMAAFGGRRVLLTGHQPYGALHLGGVSPVGIVGARAATCTSMEPQHGASEMSL